MELLRKRSTGRKNVLYVELNIESLKILEASTGASADFGPTSDSLVGRKIRTARTSGGSLEGCCLS